MFSFWTGRKFSNAVADHLGIKRSLYSSALLESGITWYHMKLLKQRGATLGEASEELMPACLRGLEIIDHKFGPQPEIDDALRKARAWYQR